MEVKNSVRPNDEQVAGFFEPGPDALVPGCLELVPEVPELPQQPPAFARQQQQGEDDRRKEGQQPARTGFQEPAMGGSME